MKKLSNSSGFTIIELLITIAFAAVIAMTIIPTLNNALGNRTNYGAEIINHVDTVSNIGN